MLWPKILISLFNKKSQIETHFALAIMSEFRNEARAYFIHMYDLYCGLKDRLNYFTRRDQYFRHRVLLKVLVLLEAKVSFEDARNILNLASGVFPDDDRFRSLSMYVGLLENMANEIALAGNSKFDAR